jgi:hypothetical protein
MEKLGANKKRCFQVTWHLDRYFNTVPADHEAGVITVLLQDPVNREVPSEGRVYEGGLSLLAVASFPGCAGR